MYALNNQFGKGGTGLTDGSLARALTELRGFTMKVVNTKLADTNIPVSGIKVGDPIAAGIVFASGVPIDVTADLSVTSDGNVQLGTINTYGGVKATGTITSNNTNVNAGGTVTIGTKVYTFILTEDLPAVAVEGNVVIGADADGSLLNLIRAINHTGTPGVDYTCAAAHPLVSAAAAVTAHAFAVTAKSDGTDGNIATTSTDNTLSWGAVTLEGGTDGGVMLLAYYKRS